MRSESDNWNETKGKIKAKYGKLSDSDIEGLNGHMDQLTTKLQKTYQYDKVRADQESRAFNESLKKNQFNTFF